jgi:hypothetical protein
MTTDRLDHGLTSREPRRAVPVGTGMLTRKRCRLSAAWLRKSVAGVGASGSLTISESARSGVAPVSELTATNWKLEQGRSSSASAGRAQDSAPVAAFR